MTFRCHMSTSVFVDIRAKQPLKAIRSTASKVYRNASWPPKLCICVDRQNISPLYSPPLYPNKGIQMWMRSRGTTSVFPVDICKTLYLLSILEGSCFLLCFPPNWFQPIRVRKGGGGGWAVMTDRGAPLSDLQPGSQQHQLSTTAGLRRALLWDHWLIAMTMLPSGLTNPHRERLC